MDSNLDYDWTGWTRKMFLDELRKRKANLSGRKDDLRQRLEAYLRNDNFGALLTTEEDFQMTLPDKSSYKDLTDSARAGLNNCNRETVDSFLKEHRRTDTPGLKLYNSRFIRFLRFSNCPESGITYFAGQVRAEMRRTTTYDVNISIEKDGTIKESECDCAAGMGPNANCKHTVSVILALLDFFLCKPVILELSCTDQLQTFHQPKRRHIGSPISAAGLKLHGNDESKLIFDPRPAKYRKIEGYAESVKNRTINFAATYKNNVPILQTIPPANMHAINNDHDYLDKTLKDLYLEAMNITTITPEEADSLEENTVTQRKCALWREERKKRLPSSKFGQILHAKSLKAKKRIAKEIMSGASVCSKPLSHGIKNEHKAIRAYEEKFSLMVVPCGLVVSPDIPYLASSPDGLIGEDIVLEVKCPYAARDREINDISVPYLKLNSDGCYKLDISHNYYAQIQAQMMLTERKLGHLVVYTYKDMKKIDIPYDPQFAENMKKDLSDYFTTIFLPMFLDIHYFRCRPNM